METKGKILIIDDEKVIRDLFKRFLPRRGYEFFSAENGSEGLKAIKEVDPDLVFCDLKMPGIDGLEVLKRSKDINKDLPIIILTGHGDLESAIQTVKIGAYNFMRKPIEDLETLLIDIDKAIGNYHLIKKNNRLSAELVTINKELENKVKARTEDLEMTLSELKAAQTKINEEIKIVSLVQQKLLPDGPPNREGLDAAAIYLASSAVGGDYYDYIDMGDNKLGIVIADVSGHGLPAGFVMTMVKVMLLYLNKQEIPYMSALAAINDMLTTHIPTNNFVSMIYGALDLKEMTFTYTNAGHEPLLRVNGETKEIEEIPAQSPFLGIDSNTKFIEDCLHLKKGDKLILTTDGIIESVNPKNELFGTKRLNDIITKNTAVPSMDLITEIISDLSVYCEGIPYEDDITMVVLGIK